MSRKKAKTAAPKGTRAARKSTTAAARGTVPSPTQEPPDVLELPIPRRSSTAPVENDPPPATPPPEDDALRDPSLPPPGAPVVSVGDAIASERNDPSNAAAPDKFGLSDMQHVMSAKDLAHVLSIVVADQFGYDRERRKLFQQQFQDYLPKLGAENEKSFTMLTDEKTWFHNSIHVAYSCVNVTVVRLLSQLADYTSTVLRRGKFLTPSVRYKSLEQFVLGGTDHPGRYDARGSDSSIAHVSQNYSNDKLPGFKVPKFDGDTLTGDVYLKKIKDTFKSAGQGLYLEDEDHCTERIAWSGAFASRIRESVADSATLAFLSTELEEENNCAVVFQRISDHLSSSDLATARIFETWMQFFNLKCSTRDEFLGFFSSAKSILHKLKTANSVAVTDDTFIRAYLAKTIEAPELQQEVKQFIISSDGDYESILDKVFKDFRAQESSEHLRASSGTTGSVSFTATARRGATKAAKPAASESTGSETQALIPFPTNFANAMPAHVYSQVKEWYPHAARKNDKDRAWLRNFKWKHFDPTKTPKYQRQLAYDKARDKEYHRTSRRGHREEYEYDTEDDYSYRHRRSRRSRHDRSPSRSPSPRRRRRGESPPAERPSKRDEPKEGALRSIRHSRRIGSSLFRE